MKSGVVLPVVLLAGVSVLLSAAGLFALSSPAAEPRLATQSTGPTASGHPIKRWRSCVCILVANARSC